MGGQVRPFWTFAIAGVIGCSDKAPPPEPGIEATVVEVKQIAAAEPPPKPVPPPPPVEPPKPETKPVITKAPQPKHTPPPAVTKKPEPASPAQPAQPDNKTTLEQNPYVYK
jgi:protein TonB